MLSITVNQSIQANFDKVINEALIHTKRTVGQVCNSTLFFVVRNAINLTPHTDKGTIRNNLLAASQTAPNVPLAAILVNVRRGQKGEIGLHGEEMKSAVETFINTRQSHRNYIRSRWIPASKKMQSSTKYKSGAKRVPSGIVANGKTRGGAEPAGSDWKASGRIWAVIDKLKNPESAGKLLHMGLEEAVKEETGNKLKHLLEKQIEEGIIQFNRS